MPRRQRGEGGLFQRGDGRWVGSVELGWSDGRRKRRRVYGNTMAECQAKLKKAKAAADAGSTQTAATRLDTWLTTWLAEVCPGKERMRPDTLANYESYCRNYLVPVLGKVRLDQLAAQHFRALRKHVLDKGLSTTTAGHAHAILSTALNDAIREGLITRNPGDLVDRPRNAKSQRRALTLVEVRRLLHVVEGDRLETRWHTALLLGMRQGECLGLRWDRVDLDNGVITVDTQLQRIPYVHGCGQLDLCRTINKADRCTRREIRTLPGYEYQVVQGNLCLVVTKTDPKVVPIPGVLLDGLTRHGYSVADHVNGSDLVWQRPGGGPIDGGDDRGRWHEILQAAAIPDTDLHSARHTTATLLLALGVPEDVRMAILGHSVAATTQKYTHVDLTLSRRALGQLESAITDDTRSDTTVKEGKA